MARKRTAQIEVLRPDYFADECASMTVRWFTPADWDIEDDHPDAAGVRGWYFRDNKNVWFWHGPFLTSTEAAAAEVASFQKAA